jgi:sugar/nucleoside kinase (ribokinase family)
MSATKGTATERVEFIAWLGGKDEADEVIEWLRKNGVRAKYDLDSDDPEINSEYIIFYPNGEPLVAAPGDAIVRRKSGQFHLLYAFTLRDVYDIVEEES